MAVTLPAVISIVPGAQTAVGFVIVNVGGWLIVTVSGTIVEHVFDFVPLM